MPPNDLASFDVLSIDDGEVVPSTVATTTATTTTTKTWASAVQTLWLTPLPRIIVAEAGGESFMVMCVEGLRIQRRSSANNKETLACWLRKKATASP